MHLPLVYEWESWCLYATSAEGGKYVIRLEEKYSVKITFPRDSEDTGPDEGKGTRRETLKSDEVLIKGGKKGVSGAKAEILEVWQEFHSVAHLGESLTPSPGRGIREGEQQYSQVYRTHPRCRSNSWQGRGINQCYQR